MTSEGDGLGRRQLLKAAGLAAVADLGAVAERAEARTVAPDDPGVETLLSRLPVPAESPEEYDVTVARRLDEDALQTPDLLADADAHASLVSSRGSLTMGLGVPSEASATVDALERRGFDRAETVEGRPTFVSRGRYRQRVAVVDEETVVLGRSASLAPAASLVRAVAAPRAESIEDRLPAVSEVLDRLGPGAVLSLSPTGEPSSGAQAVAAGRRLSIDPGRLRAVAVYPSRGASESALDTARSSGSGTSRFVRKGRALIADRAVGTEDIPSAVED